MSFVDSSVVSNIALGQSINNIDIEKITKILKCVELEETISALEENLNTNIGEGGIKLSGGGDNVWELLEHYINLQNYLF